MYKVADLEGGREPTHIISHLLEAVEMFGKTVDILNFSDTARQLQLNQTNAEFLLNAFGDDPQTWGDKPVTLYLAEYDFKGKKKLGMRLKRTDTAAAEAGATRARARLTDGKTADMNDEIPFLISERVGCERWSGLLPTRSSA
jgi:hypothetical protein